MEKKAMVQMVKINKIKNNCLERRLKVFYWIYYLNINKHLSCNYFFMAFGKPETFFAELPKGPKVNDLVPGYASAWKYF